MQSATPSKIVPIHEKTVSATQSSLRQLTLVIALAFALFFLKPAELSAQAWTLFTVFVATIVSIVLKILPMGALSLIAVAILAGTKTTPLKTILESFSFDLIWLIIFSCFLARAFIKTGLGNRVAYLFIRLFGGTPIGLGYGFLLSASVMAPLIPSATARTGGIILPILRSIVQVLGREQKAERIATFLTLLVMNSSVLTSCMFLTSNGGNPIAVKFAKTFNVNIDFSTWFLAALVPSIICFLLLPLLLKFFLPCSIDNAHVVVTHAKEQLHGMGPVSRKEKITLGVFALLLGLWSFGNFFNVHATEAALIGVGLLLVTTVLNWDDILNEELAWDTFFWMAILVMMASELQSLGVISYFTKHIAAAIPTGGVPGSPGSVWIAGWVPAFIILALLYFYTHYFFASTTAHLTSMFIPFVGVLCSLGAPPLATVFAFAFMTNLFGGLTQYSSGPSPIVYALGFVAFKTWLKIGVITSAFYLLIWLGGGFIWWKILGLY